MIIPHYYVLDLEPANLFPVTHITSFCTTTSLLICILRAFEPRRHLLYFFFYRFLSLLLLFEWTLLYHLLGLLTLPPSHHELLTELLKEGLVSLDCTSFNHAPGFLVGLNDLFEVFALYDIELGIVFDNTELVGVATLENEIDVSKELTLT